MKLAEYRRLTKMSKKGRVTGYWRKSSGRRVFVGPYMRGAGRGYTNTGGGLELPSVAHGGHVTMRVTRARRG